MSRSGRPKHSERISKLFEWTLSHDALVRSGVVWTKSNAEYSANTA